MRCTILGLDCDISLNNPLALRNTKMLRLYSEIDGRVRTLSFLIKHWAQVLVSMYTISLVHLLACMLY